MKNSVDGLKVLWRNETAFRQELYLSLIAIVVLLNANLPSLLKFILILMLLLLLTTEAINSAIETVIDRISTEPHVQSKMAKDIGSAAVSIMLIANIAGWIYAGYVHFTALP